MLVQNKYPDELRADFQQYYGLNIDGMGTDYSYYHAAVLVMQLPPNSRVSAAMNPDAAWDVQSWFLNQIEYDLRVLIWQNTKDAEKGRNKPKPNKTPKELMAQRRRAMNFDKDLVDSVLGIGRG